MNPVTFNEPFAAVFKTHAMYKGLLDSPLLVWNHESSTLSSHSDIEIIYNQKGILLPFQMFRVSNHKNRAMYVQLAHNHFHAYVYGPPLQEFVRFFNIVLNCDEQHQPGTVSRNGTSALFHIKSGKLIRMTNKEEVNHDMEQGINQMITSTLALCFDFQNPHFHLCRKSPQIPKGHSVVWQKSREHFVLIHKNHSANRAENIGKKLITDGPTIDRCAHSRRAHIRMLRSPKFKNKQGQKIWIKSIWVGPKEWTDRSGQIYKIVDS